MLSNFDPDQSIRIKEEENLVLDTLPAGRLVVNPAREGSRARAGVEREARSLAVAVNPDGAAEAGLGLAGAGVVVEAIAAKVAALADLSAAGELQAEELG